MSWFWKNCLIALILLVPCASLQAEEFDPAKTHAVIVGVLEWKHGLTPYPKRHRKDQELYDLLVKRGTPKENIALLLDQEATLEKIREAITSTARKAGEGSTLLIYYAGHGMPADGTDYCFANWEINTGRMKETGWSLKGLGEMLASEFKGKRVILCADCCFSGGLEVVVNRLAEQKIAAALITSAGPTNVSTNNWTFTQSLIDALSGEPLCDRDGNGQITLGELGIEVREAMKHMEHQLHGYKSQGIEEDWIIARVGGEQPPAQKSQFPLGSYVVALDSGNKRVGRVVAIEGENYTVQFYDYSDKRTAQYVVGDLTASTGEAVAPMLLDVGVVADCEVEWQGRWYPAKLLKTEDGKYHIHYVGYDASWDEWVGKDRYRKLNPKPEVQPLPDVTKNGDSEVEWNGTWYPAVTLKTEKGTFYIHYVGYGDSWDEWVEPNRYRKLEPKKPAEKKSNTGVDAPGAQR